MQAFLKLSRVIDFISERIGRLMMWFILAATLISAGNAIVRMTPLPQESALTQLDLLLKVYEEGMRWPLPLPPLVALQWLKDKDKDNDKDNKSGEQDQDPQKNDQQKDDKGKKNENPKDPKQGDKGNPEDAEKPKDKPGDEKNIQPKEGQISKADLDKLLEALKNEEMKLQQKLMRKDSPNEQNNIEKDW